MGFGHRVLFSLKNINIRFSLYIESRRLKFAQKKSKHVRILEVWK
ncbi:hypothetical protein HCH_00001 [Hahella chejuensis KCTC 2396]|uniref:Uncharacterized protein n=1 Tax=Hahella chejuensis (strain KCTC 2396) TaxID=349521 RepID=Q2SR00_HAHCH|nr:hypothetical protein HCH_00001 [Hahella chejuensis KCTC 2396]